MDSIEHNLDFIGFSTIENKLKDNVVQCIDDFKKAGTQYPYNHLDIKIWMMTGDKKEVSTAIAKSSNIFKEEDNLLYLDSLATLPDDIVQCRSILNSQKTEKNVNNVLFMAGEVISGIKNSDYFARNFMQEIISRCKCIICYRASPIEKADAVRLV